MKYVAFAIALARLPRPPGPQAQLPYKPYTVTSPDGVKLSVQEWGNPNGPAILFVHGYSQAWLSWMRQVTDPEMAKRFRMVTFDLRGHGNSDKPNDKAAYHENKRWADDVKAIIDELKINKPVLVGWSYAGRVVCDYLMAYGDSGVSGVNYVAAMTKAETNAGAPAGTPSGGMANPDLITQTRSVAEFLRFCFEKQPDAEGLRGDGRVQPTHAGLRARASRRPHDSLRGDAQGPEGAGAGHSRQPGQGSAQGREPLHRRDGAGRQGLVL